MNTKSSTKIMVIAEKMRYRDYLKSRNEESKEPFSYLINEKGYVLYHEWSGWVSEKIFHQVYSQADPKYKFLLTLLTFPNTGGAYLSVAGNGTRLEMDGILLKIYVNAPEEWKLTIKEINGVIGLSSLNGIPFAELDALVSKVLDRDLIEIIERFR